MRRVKTWARFKSGQNHLNSIMFAHIHMNTMDKINFERLLMNVLFSLTYFEAGF